MMLNLLQKKGFGVALFALTVTYVIFVYIFKINLFPNPGGDEYALLNISFRAVNYNDLDFPVYYPLSGYQIGIVRNIPNSGTDILRSFLHVIFGFSGYLSRVLSSLFVLASIFSFLAFFKIYVPKISYLKISSIFVLVALTPGIILCARTVRSEQEILFWGIFGIFGCLALVANFKFKKFFWFLSGVCLGIAGVSHLFGLLFPFCMLAILLLHYKDLYEYDGLTFFQRILSWGLGALIPVGSAIGNMSHHIQKYYEGARTFTAIRNQTFTDIFSTSFEFSIFSYPHRVITKLISGNKWFDLNFLLPQKIKAFLYQSTYYSLSKESTLYFIEYYSFFSISIIFLFTVILFKWGSLRKQREFFPVIVSFYLMFSALVVTLLYTKSQEYYAYLAFSFTCFLTAIIVCKPFQRRGGNRNAFSIFCTGLFVSILFFNVLTSINLIRTVFRMNSATNLSVDGNFKLIEKVKAKYINSISENGEVIVDTITWPFAHNLTGSWVSVFSGHRPHHPVGASFNSNAIDFFIRQFPTVSVFQTPIETRRNYFTEILNNQNLNAITLLPKTNASNYFYSINNSDEFMFSIANADNDIKIYLGHAIPLQGHIHEIIHGRTKIVLPHLGDYLFIFSSSVAGMTLENVKFFSKTGEIMPFLASPKSEECPQYSLLNLTSRELEISGVGRQDIKKIIYLGEGATK